MIVVLGGMPVGTYIRSRVRCWVSALTIDSIFPSILPRRYPFLQVFTSMYCTRTPSRQSSIASLSSPVNDRNKQRASFTCASSPLVLLQLSYRKPKLFRLLTSDSWEGSHGSKDEEEWNRQWSSQDLGTINRVKCHGWPWPCPAFSLSLDQQAPSIAVHASWWLCAQWGQIVNIRVHAFITFPCSLH